MIAQSMIVHPREKKDSKHAKFPGSYKVVHMPSRIENVTIEPVRDPEKVNLVCLVMVQCGQLEANAQWGKCDCAVCSEYRALR